jgi:hypothetical protein
MIEVATETARSYPAGTQPPGIRWLFDGGGSSATNGTKSAATMPVDYAEITNLLAHRNASARGGSPSRHGSFCRLGDAMTRMAWEPRWADSWWCGMGAPKVGPTASGEAHDGRRRVSLAEARQLAIEYLLQAEGRRREAHRREAAFWAALDEEP